MSFATQNGSLRAAFGFGFAHRLVPQGAACGVFDGTGMEQLVVGTETGKLCIQGTESIFNVNERITCLGVYPRHGIASDIFDAVVIGTTTSLWAMDLFNNKTLFHRELPEGVRCIKVGNVDDQTAEPVIICGCGTTIWGFRLDGSDIFWTALGEQVNAVELCDMDGDRQNELIVGIEGADIKVLKNASFFGEFDEGDPCLSLATLRPATFAFGLASGVVGVYGQGERLWRVKTKSQIVALLPFPDRVHIACVWQGAKIDIRSAPTGEIRSKEQFEGGELSCAFLADLAGTGPLDTGEPQPQLTLVFRNGQIRALEFRSGPSSVDEGQQLREISQRKHALLEELKNYERRGSGTMSEGTAPIERSLVPQGTTLSCVLDLAPPGDATMTAQSSRGSSGSVVDTSTRVARGGESLCLRLSLSNEVPIRAVLLFAEGIFESECYAIHPNGKESAEVLVHFNPTKNVLAELFIKVMAGYAIERQLRVFEINQVLPRFVTFVHTERSGELPESFIAFRMHSRLDQLRHWISENFVFVDEEKLLEDGAEGQSGQFQMKFFCTRNQEPMLFQLDFGSGEAQLRHNNIQNAADLVQSMCAYMGIRELPSRAHFPHLLESVQSAIESMEDRYEVNERLASELAERLNIVRECVVRAEDALAIRNFPEARRLYARVVLLNRELDGHQTVRVAARKELLDALKLLNVSIEHFSRLRVGSSAAALIQECRKAIAADNMELLPKLLEFGV